ncbi:MAG: hypothetical protein AAGC63_00175 [Propionicimonas sp.]|nr:hypothetical protein [Propionicimonas sp.]
MSNILIRVAVFLGEAAIAFIVAALVVPGFTVTLPGLSTAVIAFAVCQSVFTWAASALSRKYAPALVILVGLVSTLLSLLVASQFEGGITLTGTTTWLLATLVVWAVTSLASWLLRRFVLKDRQRA